MREAGQRIQPNLSGFTVASVINMKQLYRLPFQRNAKRIKHPTYEYETVSTRLMTYSILIILNQTRFTFFIVRECWKWMRIQSPMSLFSWMRLASISPTPGEGEEHHCHRAVVDGPGLHGGNITMCAAITNNGVLHHHASLGPYNTDLIWTNCMT